MEHVDHYVQCLEFAPFGWIAWPGIRYLNSTGGQCSFDKDLINVTVQLVRNVLKMRTTETAERASHRPRLYSLPGRYYRRGSVRRAFATQFNVVKRGALLLQTM